MLNNRHHGTISAGRVRMDALTPELERRLQVEELWARREVLADSINARRLEYFQSRCTLLTRFGTAGERAPVSDKLEEPAEQQDSAPKPLDLPHAMLSAEIPMAIPVQSLRWLAAAAIAATVIALSANLPLTELASTARAKFDVFLPRIVRLVQSREPASAPQRLDHTSLSSADPPDLRTEVAAEIAASLGHKAQGAAMQGHPAQ